MHRLSLTVSLLLIASCGSKDKNKEPPPAADSPDVQEAQHIFHTLCVTCHGESGKGDGVASVNLNPKPRNYTDKAWQASVTDDQIRQIILKGGSGVGKSPVMPASPQLESKPGVVDGLVAIVRSFGK